MIRVFPASLLLVLLLLSTSPALADFFPNGDGTVTDDATGLVWDRCTLGRDGSDCSTGSVSVYTWAEALDVVVSANAANHKGFNDWRLPNRTELESLVDRSVPVSPHIDVGAFPNTPSFWYWTSTSWARNPSHAWVVNFGSATSSTLNKTNILYVRLVRGGGLASAYDTQAPDAVHVPTLTAWSLPLLAGLLAVIAIGRVRRAR